VFRKCKHCGFRNPPDVGDCLFCHRDLPITVGEAKEAWKNLSDLARGKVGQVGVRVVKEEVGALASSVKYRFHPRWILKIKLHRLKRTLIDLVWVFGVIGGIVLLGLLYNILSGLFKGR
jgi:hypothetical protein